MVQLTLWLCKLIYDFAVQICPEGMFSYESAHIDSFFSFLDEEMFQKHIRIALGNTLLETTLKLSVVIQNSLSNHLTCIPNVILSFTDKLRFYEAANNPGTNK